MKKIAFFFLLAVAVACGGDDDSGSTSGAGANKYTYLDHTYSIGEAQYYIVDEDVYFFFDNYNNGDYYSAVQIIFANKMLNAIGGSYTANPDRFSQSYDPATNFWSGNVTYADNAAGDEIDGGNVKINLSENNTKVDVTFTVTTDAGKTAVGHYAGTISERQ
jgi:hypothetical protein